MNKYLLAIETSCDDTSVALLKPQGEVAVLQAANQDFVHRVFGGVVPEIASRNHALHLPPMINEVLKSSNIGWNQIESIAVTNRPGLIGSLIVGTVVAKTLAQVHNIPFIGVNHLEGHILAPLLRDAQWAPPAGFGFPFLALAVSGGHTSIYRVEDWGKYFVLGRTRDDAAGEAFDKFGKMLGLGFPGGAEVDRLAQNGDPSAYQFPHGLTHEKNLMMSFSGMKSSAQRLVEKLGAEQIQSKRSDLCASFQEAVVDTLIEKLDRAVTQEKLQRVIITGGVSANSRLRSKAESWANRRGLQLVIPPLRYCTDNAAMIGLAGQWRMTKGQRSGLDLAPMASSAPGDFIEEIK